MKWTKAGTNNIEKRAREESLLIKLLSLCVEGKVQVKELTQKLLDEFSTLNNILHADKYKLSSIIMHETKLSEVLELFQELMNNILYSKIKNSNILANRSQLLDYLKFKMGGLDFEQFRIIFLNKKNILLADEIISEGTIDEVPFYPREIIKRALFHGAGAIIIVHNHPSNNPKPSAHDLLVTDKIIKVCQVFDIAVHDHLIVTKNDYFSCLA
jgi:DNA repair protein RadC